MSTTNLTAKGVELITHYFPSINKTQQEQFAQLAPLYGAWNQKINVISKKDIHNLYLHHVLHSLSIAKVIPFLPESKILDLGTGGGFPGIPLAILFPDTHFTLVDSIAKKMKVVEAVVNGLGLTNVTLLTNRVEKMSSLYDFIIVRAVAALPKLCQWTAKMISPLHQHSVRNGLLCLKGGNLHDELADLPLAHHIYPITDYFDDDYFITKKILHVFSPAQLLRSS